MENSLHNDELIEFLASGKPVRMHNPGLIAEVGEHFRGSKV